MAILVLLSQLQKIYKLHTCALLHRFQILYIGRGYNFFIYLTKTSPTNSLYSFPGDCLGFFKGVLHFSSHTSYTTSTNKQKGSTVHILPPLVSTKAIVCFLSVNRTKQSHPPAPMKTDPLSCSVYLTKIISPFPSHIGQMTSPKSSRYT